MSRSYKKTLGHCDRNPFMKNQSNRRLRRLSIDETLADGRAYAKLMCSWDICDFRLVHYSESRLRAKLWTKWCKNLLREVSHISEDSFEEYFINTRNEYRIK